MNDLISRSAVLDLAYCAIKPTHDNPSVKAVVDVDDIERLPAIDAVPVVHEKGIRSSIITAKDTDEWQDRIILADESTQVCAVYYADDSERVPVVHARWIKTLGSDGFVSTLRCSRCGNAENSTYVPGNFCWYCGAKMDG